MSTRLVGNKAAAGAAHAPAAGIRIGSPRRSLFGHGFSGSGVASQIVTVPPSEPLARR